ncbi:MAG: hypothetical protein ACI9YH_004936 [Colwellia sp.]|jgi:hypothetical protein
MSKPKIVKYAVFEIDVDKDSYSEVDLSSINDNHLSQFILKLANDTSSNDSSRKATFNSSSYAKSAMEELAEKDSTTKLNELARQLLVTEKDFNLRIKHLNNSIRPGSLIIAKVERSADTFILMAKIEFSSYLARKSFLLETGLPQEKSLTRSCLVKVVNSKIAENVILAGSNGTIPAYWHRGFLASTFLRDNTINTDQAFKLIESKMSYIRDLSKEDYIDLRDCLIGYFKGNKLFNFDELTENLTEKFTPESTKVDLNKLKAKLQVLKKQDKFDGSFEIDKSQVKARVRKKYTLDHDIELVTNSGTGKIFQTSKNQKTYVVIESEKVSPDFRNMNF